MNDLLRPSLYDAYHETVPARLNNSEPREYQVVGPICETGNMAKLGFVAAGHVKSDRLLAILYRFTTEDQ